MISFVFLIAVITSVLCNDKLMTHRQREEELKKMNHTCSPDTLKVRVPDGYIVSFAQQINVAQTNNSENISMLLRDNIYYVCGTWDRNVSLSCNVSAGWYQPLYVNITEPYLISTCNSPKATNISTVTIVPSSSPRCKNFSSEKVQILDNVRIGCANASLNETYVCGFDGLYYNVNGNSTAGTGFADLSAICTPKTESFYKYLIRIWTRVISVVVIILIFALVFMILYCIIYKPCCN